MTQLQFRNLRLLILDDQLQPTQSLESGFGRRFLELVTVYAPRALSSHRGPGVRTWAQLLAELRAAADKPDHPLRTWDLLVSDLLFIGDPTAPTYPVGWDGDTEACPNGFGLIHTLALLACRGRNGQPFGWGLRSANAGALADDPVAVTTYGLLEALNGAPPGQDRLAGEDLSEPKALFRQRLLEMPRTSITDGTWQRALLSYRDRLLHGAATRQLTIRLIGDVQRWRRAFRDGESVRDFSEQGLGIRCGVHEQQIALPSLFADHIDEARRFNPSFVGTDTRLEIFLSKLNPHVWPTAETLVEMWRRVHEANAEGLDDVLAGCTKQEKTGIFALTWLYRAQHGRFADERRALQLKDVLGELNLQTDPPEAKYKRLLEATKGELGLTPEQVMSHLQKGKWPLDQVPALTEAAAALASEWHVELPRAFAPAKDLIRE